MRVDRQTGERLDVDNLVWTLYRKCINMHDTWHQPMSVLRSNIGQYKVHLQRQRPSIREYGCFAWLLPWQARRCLSAFNLRAIDETP